MKNTEKQLCAMYFTCHIYKSLWEPFMKLKEKYLGNNYKLYFCTDLCGNEELNYENINILTYPEKSDNSLKGNMYDRYIDYLNKIDNEYILYFYDDMFVIKNVDNNVLDKCVKIMDNNKNIKIIKLSLDSFPFSHGTQVEYDNIKFIKADKQHDDYLFNTQPIIIERKCFIEMIEYCKLHNKIPSLNGGLEITGTIFFKKMQKYDCLRVVDEVIHVPSACGVVQAGFLNHQIDKYLQQTENIYVKRYKNNLIYELTNTEYSLLGERDATAVDKVFYVK